MSKLMTYNIHITMKKFITLLIFLVTLSLVPGETLAARLFSTGMEFQNAASGVEWTTTTDAPTISTTVKNGGAASLSISTATTRRGFTHTITSSSAYYMRTYFHVVPGAGTGAALTIGVKNASNIYAGYVTITEGATPTLAVFSNSTSSAISNTASLTNNTWHRLEMFANSADGANLDDLTVRIDGVQVANSNTLNLVGSLVTLDIGAATVSGSGDVFYIDDVAVNDISGTAQTSWPGIGKIVAARPNAAGFVACENAATFSAINETPASDAVTGATDRCDITTNGGATVTHNVTDSSTLGINSYNTINLVYTMHRMREVTTGATNWAPLLSANGSATTTGTSFDTGDATTVRTNPNGTTAFGSGIISYTNPATGVAWTPTGTNSIDSMKLGFTSTDANPDITNATAAAMIEYVDVVPYVPLGPLYFSTGKLIFTNGKMSII